MSALGNLIWSNWIIARFRSRKSAHLHGEDRRQESATPFGAGVLGNDGGREGVVTANAEAHNEAPKDKLHISTNTCTSTTYSICEKVMPRTRCMDS